MKYLTKSILKLKPRKKKAHKGDFGRILVVAGSEDFPGAAVMASSAAEAILRSGADYVVVASPKKVAWVINTYLPDVITKKFNCKYFSLKDANKIINLSKNFDVLLIGPGLSKKSIQFAGKIIRKISKPKVIDADAIKAVNVNKVKNCIITPHKREFEILLKNSKVKNIQKKLNSNVILLKGPVDKIMSKNKVVYNKTGNAVMTKAGTGDVLAGLCAGFLAQTKDLFKSACMAAYINGKIGDYLLKKKGREFIASDLMKNINKVFK